MTQVNILSIIGAGFIGAGILVFAVMLTVYFWMREE